MHIFLASLPPGVSSSDVCFFGQLHRLLLSLDYGFSSNSHFSVPNGRFSHLLGIKWRSEVREHQAVSECYLHGERLYPSSAHL